jgi:two-component system nitrate/nitrite response regulator NarL
LAQSPPPTTIRNDDMASPAPHLRRQSHGAVRVQVADGQPLFREGLVRSLEDCAGMVLVAEAAEGSSALAQLRRCHPDVAVVDHGLASVDGPRLATIARRERLPTRIVILGTIADGPMAYRALSSGAAAYVTKDAEFAELQAVVHAVAAGRVVLPPAVQTCIASEIRLRHQSDRPLLTAREGEILALVADDCSTSIIARRLHLSAATVQTHVQHIYAKLEVSDRAAAVAAAFRLGLME